MVTTFYPPHHFGGDGVFVYRLAHALGDLGHHVDVLHSVDAYTLQHPDPPPVAFAEHPNVRRIPLQSRRPFLASISAHQSGRPAAYGREIRAVLDSTAYDVIHFHNVSLMGGPGVLRYGRGVKLYTTHEYWLICPTHVLFAFNRKACTRRLCLACTMSYRRPPQLWRYTGWTRRCLRSIDALLVPSRFAADAHRAVGIDCPIVHLPHFVPEPAANQTHRRKHAVDSNGTIREPYFLCVGRLEKLKGVQDLVAVFEHYREASLVIVGDGTHAAQLKAQAAHLPHVHFLGSVHPAELSVLYDRARAVLVPSLCYETFGLTAAEALMHATPAVVRRIGALTEIVEQTQAGYAFETPTECVDALRRLVQDDEHRRTLGDRGRQAARRLWSLDAHLGRYMSVIEAIRSGRGVETIPAEQNDRPAAPAAAPEGGQGSHRAER